MGQVGQMRDCKKCIHYPVCCWDMLNKNLEFDCEHYETGEQK